MTLDVLAVTGSRADWGLLAPALGAIRDSGHFRVHLAATGQHLVPRVGSLEAIATDGFDIDYRIDLGLEDTDDNAMTVARATGRALAGVAEILAEARPDLLIVLGDRYEIFGAATAALFARVPVAHLCGGDVTEGAVDDAMRHSLTKLSHLHFVTNEVSARRVAQLGEDPSSIFTVGSPGLDRIRHFRPMPRAAFFEEIGLKPRTRNVIVTFHPVTLAADSITQCRALLMALDSLDDVGILITGSNADAEGRTIDRLMTAFAADREHVVFNPSLGSERYFSAMSHVDAVIGNSSSGLYEAPSFALPTVNIGDRQKGRPRAQSVIDCLPDANAIRKAVDEAFALDCSGVENPYGDGYAAERIVAALRSVGDPRKLIRKRFRDLNV